MIFVSGVQLSQNQCSPGGAFLGNSIINNNCGCGDITNNNGPSCGGCNDYNGAGIVNFNCGGTINNSGGIKSNCGCAPLDCKCACQPAANNDNSNNNNDNNNSNNGNDNNSTPADNSQQDTTPADNSTPANDNNQQPTQPADNNQTPADNDVPADNSAVPADNSQSSTNDLPTENTGENIADTNAEAAGDSQTQPDDTTAADNTTPVDNTIPTDTTNENTNNNDNGQVCTCTKTQNLGSVRKVTKTVVLESHHKKAKKLQARDSCAPKLKAKKKILQASNSCQQENAKTNLQLQQSRSKVLGAIRKVQLGCKPVQLKAERLWVDKKKFQICHAPRLQAKKKVVLQACAPPKKVLQAPAPVQSQCAPVLKNNNNQCGCEGPMIINNNGFGAGNCGCGLIPPPYYGNNCGFGYPACGCGC